MKLVADDYFGDPLADFKEALADWLEVHRTRIWVEGALADTIILDELIRCLADMGVQIPTPYGQMTLRDLLGRGRLG